MKTPTVGKNRNGDVGMHRGHIRAGSRPPVLPSYAEAFVDPCANGCTPFQQAYYISFK